jgi:hypothetical protein
LAEGTLKAFHGFDELMTDMKIRGLMPLAEHEVTRIRKEVDNTLEAAETAIRERMRNLQII